jgi:hypothetical protein
MALFYINPVQLQRRRRAATPVERVRISLSRGLAHHEIAPAAPDDFIAAVVQDAVADPPDVDLSVALDETGEVCAPSQCGHDLATGRQKATVTPQFKITYRKRQ